jgi:hypothetical protein
MRSMASQLASRTAGPGKTTVVARPQRSRVAAFKPIACSYSRSSSTGRSSGVRSAAAAAAAAAGAAAPSVAHCCSSTLLLQPHAARRNLQRCRAGVCHRMKECRRARGMQRSPAMHSLPVTPLTLLHHPYPTPATPHTRQSRRRRPPPPWWPSRATSSRSTSPPRTPTAR